MKTRIITILFACTLLLPGCRGTKEADRPVVVATAANMQFAMEALADDFEAQTGVGCELIIGSSGKLTAQILEGAPFDIFVSADMKYPEEVSNMGLAASVPRSYAMGSLVLWTLTEGVTPSMELLTTDSVTHIALANPVTAPYGRAAMEVLDRFGLGDSVAHKLVFGESIAQTNQFISSGAAELGFTALSVVKSPQMNGKGKWIPIAAKFHSPIEQGVVLLRGEGGTEPSPVARSFYDYLLSPEATEILEKFGYSVSE